MTIAVKVCPKCGATITGEAPRGLCSVCLFKTGLGEIDNGNGQERNTVPTSFGDYELLEEIGRGGQGVVYRARQKSLSRTVALKVIGLGQWSSTPHLKRFRRDAEAAARLDHPQIVPIYEIGEREGSCYFSMKFVEGGQLDQVLKREPMSARRAVELLVKMARTVHFAHEHGILHRDIKPGNILLDNSGEPHLTDFGLARLVEQDSTITNSFDVLGTPSYMAPEQAAGHAKELKPAADVYSLGAVFYQMLTGEPPFAGGTTYETIRMVLETEPKNPRIRNPKVDVDLATICLKCLEKDPQRRYSTALDLAEDLERWLRHEPIHARRIGPLTRGKKWLRRNPATASLVVAVVSLAAAVGVIIWKLDLIRPTTHIGIAVLPFENLSGSEEDEVFADGVQDDILTKLAKVADLKVISRTSVMRYRGTRNTRQISELLNVSHVVEGTVRRFGGKVHVNAQLVEAQTDTGIWAEEYDHDLNNVFAIAADAAQSIAHRLRVKVSAREKQAMSEWPTRDLVAYDLYTRAKNLLFSTTLSSATEQNLRQAVGFLDQAVSRDPSFFEAYYQLTFAHELLYSAGFDHTPERLASAEAALKATVRLRPDAGETRLAQAQHLYYGPRDYGGALSELEKARRTLPNDHRVFELTGYILRRRGQPEEGVRNLEKVIELDPGNYDIMQQLALSYQFLRRYPEAAAILDRALTIVPKDNVMKVARALVDFYWKADTKPLHQTLESIVAAEPDEFAKSADNLFSRALMERDSIAAERALAALGSDNPCWSDGAVRLRHSFGEGLVARMMNDEAKASAAFTKARAEQEKIVQEQPDYGPALCVLGLIDAALGNKDIALEEGRRAIQLLPVEKDFTNGNFMIQYFAIIAAWAGEKDLAVRQMEVGARAPVASQAVSYGGLKLMPFWDPLRGDPRFEAIVSSLAPE